MTIPVVEIFGPVIQGEGEMAGQQTYFLRTGGCDYRCSWCDTMYAVDPKQVAANSKKMSQLEIVEQINILREAKGGPKTLTISGGNPAMWDLTEVVHKLSMGGWFTCVETQGTYWKDWINDLDLLTVSPKPPSSAMKTNEKTLATFMQNRVGPTCMKIVVFNAQDFQWAKKMFLEYKDWPDTSFYLQPGTDQTYDEPNMMKQILLHRTKELTETLVTDRNLAHVRILPQIHSLVYGYARGV